MTMGISGSRGKKVAPASVTEGDPSTQMLKCQTSSIGVSPKNTQKDQLSNRKVTVVSADNENLEEELNRILEACKNTEDPQKGIQKCSVYMCGNYTFCYNQRDQRSTHTESACRADVILPNDLLKPVGFEDQMDICTFNMLNNPQKQTVMTAGKADPIRDNSETIHVPGICDDVSLASPVSYDPLEEDLMSAIEREFG
ncbi:uncharacterized protein Hap1MRO34_015645 isoform 1-T3 [Clarias gariepinus]